MEKKVIIVSGGKIGDSFAGQWIRQEQPDLTIAADSGMEFFRRIGQKPDIIIGDFDSVSPDTLDYFQAQEGIEWRKLNPIKDDTDTEFAIHLAIEAGAESITLLGATGSRLDHVFGNVELLGIGLEQKVNIQIVDENNRIRMIDSGIKIKKQEQYGTYLSLIPYSSEVTHLSLGGMKYPLEDFTLKGFSSLGISNEITAEEAEIGFEDGILLMIESKD